MSRTSRPTSSKFFIFTALLAFVIGYQADPFKKAAKPDAAKIQAQYLPDPSSGYTKDETKLPPEVTRDRVPASLKEAYANAKIAFQEGHCQEVQSNLQRLSGDFDFKTIIKNCEQKSANNAKTGKHTEE